MGTRFYLPYLLLLLLAAQTLSYVDRQVMSILAEPIKGELHLKDWQLGALAGLAFGLPFTVLGIPLARVAERVHRPRLIALSLCVWSVFTVVCGFAGNFIQLIFGRFGVGLGEAGATPAAHSLIADRVPRARRALAFAVYSAGLPLGTLCGLAVGGIIADAWGWRATFILVGTPGVLLALVLAFTLKEPRDDQPTRVSPPAPVPGFRDALKILATKKSFSVIASAAATASFIGYVHSTFFGAFFLRAHGPEMQRLAAVLGERTGVELGPLGFLGIALGVATGAMGLVGAVLGGLITDRAARRGMGAYMVVPAVSAILGVPLALGVVFAPGFGWALTFAGMTQVCRAMGYGPTFASVQSLVDPRLRSTASAVLLFVMNVVGLGTGPLVVGLLSDGFAKAGLGSIDGLRYALACAEVIVLVGALLFLSVRRTFEREFVA